MKLMMILIYIFTAFSVLADCSTGFTESNSPFLVSSATKQEDKIFENFRSLDNPSNVISYLPKESIVVSLLGKGFERSGEYHPIEVISLPGKRREDLIRKSRELIRRLLFGADRRAEKNQQGYLHSDSLNSARNYKFVLKDQDFLNLGQADEDLVVLSFVTEKGLYKVDC